MGAGTLAEPVGRPATRVVVLRDSPDHREKKHAGSGYSGADPVTAPPLELPDRLIARDLSRIRKSVRAGMRVSTSDYFRHFDSSLRLESPRGLNQALLLSGGACDG